MFFEVCDHSYAIFFQGDPSGQWVLPNFIPSSSLCLSGIFDYLSLNQLLTIFMVNLSSWLGVENLVFTFNYYYGCK